jgi:hypothetical protein
MQNVAIVAGSPCLVYHQTGRKTKIISGIKNMLYFPLQLFFQKNVLFREIFDELSASYTSKAHRNARRPSDIVNYSFLILIKIYGGPEKFSTAPPVSNFVKVCSVLLWLVHADRRTERQILQRQ